MVRKRKKSGFIVSLILLCVIGGAGFYIYQKFFAGAVHLQNKNYTFIYIDHDDSFEDVIADINAENIIENTESFEWLAKKMELDKNIHPGKYRILNGMKMRQIINLIKYNKQEKVKITINYLLHDIDAFITYADDKLEVSAAELEDFLTDEKKLHDHFRLDPENSFALLVPGTYEVSWAVTADDLFQLLEENYKAVWTEKRKALAMKMGYTVPEIITLASIVQSESTIESERQKIAGVYLNRLKIGMPLQADPTLRFANKNFDVQRFWDSDKKINSPYNTYLYKGLPPGPICPVYPQAIDATLNYVKHRYIYFCAKPELNGYSDFSVSYDQHQKYAAAYQRSLAKRGITR
ncbi:MAG: endolytic transglycosylase MltG [Bacteroidota bacterium]